MTWSTVPNARWTRCRHHHDESEGITENVVNWNTAAAASIINGVGLEHVMFESADPLVFEWYIKNYGNDVNLFVDHSQILQLEGLRQNIWGNKSTWGRVANPAPLPAVGQIRQVA